MSEPGHTARLIVAFDPAMGQGDDVLVSLVTRHAQALVNDLTQLGGTMLTSERRGAVLALRDRIEGLLGPWFTTADDMSDESGPLVAVAPETEATEPRATELDPATTADATVTEDEDEQDAAEQGRIPDAPAPEATDEELDRLRTVWVEVMDAAVRNRYAARADPPGDPAKLWRDLHLLALRLPYQDASVLRGRIGSEADDDLVVPSHDRWGAAAVDLRSPGGGPEITKRLDSIRQLCSEQAWARHQKLLDPLARVRVLMDIDPERIAVAGNEQEPHLYKIAERGWVDRFDVDLLARLGNLAGHKRPEDDPPTVDEIIALHQVLELVGRVLYEQVPADGSWWSRNLELARNHFKSLAGKVGTYKGLVGTLKTVRPLTVNTNVQVTGGAQQARGTLLWVLVPYVKLGDREFKGRVVVAS